MTPERKAAHAEYMRAWRKKNPGKWKAIAQKYRVSDKGKAMYASMRKRNRAINPESFANYRRRNREKFPEKHRARTLLWNAILAGRIVRPSQCERCGGADHIEGHHHDYSKPLDVHWLCRGCHNLSHFQPEIV